MAKLIHSQSLANIKANNTLYSQEDYTTLARGAVIFTNDGYIVARGHEYYIGTAAHGNGQTGLTITNGVLTAIDSNGNEIGSVTLPVFGAENGLTVVSGKVGHSTAKANTNITGASISSYVLNTPTWSLDTWGHVTSYAADSGAGTHVDYITDSLAAASTTYYLLGAANNTANSTYYQPKKWAGAYITTDANSKATLYVSGNMYAGGTEASNKVITSGDIGSLAGALRMKGSTGKTGSGWTSGGNGPASHSVGDVWWISTAGTYAGQTCEVGDMLICITDGSSANASHWIVGQTNWKVENTDSTNGVLIGTTKTLLATVGGVGIYARVSADVNNWRPVYLDSTSKLATDTNSGNLVFKNVSNSGITIGYDSGFTFTLDAAQTDYLGGIKIAKNTASYSVSPLTSGTISADVTATKYTKDLGYFGVETDKNNKAFVFIPTAQGNATELSRVYGLVTSTISTSPFNTGTTTLATHWNISPIIDGVVYYKDTTYTSLKNPYSFTFGGISYDGSEAKSITLGTNLSLNGTTLNATNTWRPVYAWTLSEMATSGDTIDNILAESTGTKGLAFSATFGYKEVTHTIGGNNVTVAELDLVWAEVDSDGNITYQV